MLRALLFLLAGIAAAGDVDPWGKVRELSPGTEIKIYVRAAAQPVTAKLSEARSENLVVQVKDGQKSILKEEIDRIDVRMEGKDRVSRESRSGRESRPAIVADPRTWGHPANSTSSTIKVTPGAQFKTIYKRPSANETAPPTSR
jgi:hypothetical protein